MPDTPLDEKETRQHILNTAIMLFTQQGYDETRMQDVADGVGKTLEAMQDYFASKEALVLAHYARLSEESIVQVDSLDGGTIADRFHRTMQGKIAQITPYRESIGAMFGAGMNPRSDISIMGDSAADIRQNMVIVFEKVVSGAKDATKPPQSEQVSAILYSLHLLILLFWLYDRTPENKATHELLELAHDGIKLARPMLILPFFDKSLAKLTRVLQSVFVGGGV